MNKQDIKTIVVQYYQDTGKAKTIMFLESAMFRSDFVKNFKDVLESNPDVFRVIGVTTANTEV